MPVLHIRTLDGAIRCKISPRVYSVLDNRMSSKDGSSQPPAPPPPHPLNFALKAKYAFYATLIFFLVASPETYKMTQKAFGWLFFVSDGNGCPSPLGFFLHTGAFFLVLWGAMLFPRDS